MRDIDTPEQASFTVKLIDDFTDAEIREERLQLMEARGMIEQFSTDPSMYKMTSAGLQAIMTEDLSQSLNTTNQKLSDTREGLEEMQESQSKSAAMQTVFSATIILFTTYQIVSSRRSPIIDPIDGVAVGILLIDALLAGLAIILGRDALSEELGNLRSF